VVSRRRRKGEPYNPAPVKVHDRQSTDLLRNARVAPMEIVDQYGDTIVVARSLRDDPLARLHAGSKIDNAQYQAGRAFQADFETAERGPRAIDPSKEAVDGGRPPEPITERQRKAAYSLSRVHRNLGQDGSAIVHDVLVHGRSIAQVVERRGVHGDQWEKHFGTRFRECLDKLAVFYGLATA